MTERDAGETLALDKQVAKLGREQYRLSALLERQIQSLEALQAQLREQVGERERARAEWQAQREDQLGAARVEVLVRLLPVVDSLEEALAAGRRVQARLAVSPARALEVRGWRARLAAWLQGPPSAVPDTRTQDAEAHAAFLRGLELLHVRLLETLAQEGVRLIETQGRAFDVRYHIAVDMRPAVAGQADGTVVEAVRRGYVRGTQILRYAEVVVARQVASSEGARRE